MANKNIPEAYEAMPWLKGQSTVKSELLVNNFGSKIKQMSQIPSKPRSVNKYSLTQLKYCIKMTAWKIQQTQFLNFCLSTALTVMANILK